MANAQWIFINWGQQFSTWRKACLAVFNWFLILGRPTPTLVFDDVANNFPNSFRILDGLWPLHIDL